MTALAKFFRQVKQGGLEALRDGLVGRDLPIETPFGTQRLLYADYVASGRALRQVEDFVATEVLPFYANSHTEASFCGSTMTRLREEARDTIARLVNADPDCRVVFAGSGATAGINRIVGLLRVGERVRSGDRVTVITGPYEHHSNILPWREAGAQIVEIAEAVAGGPDLDHLEQALSEHCRSDLLIGTFSAASNVTGILTDVDAVTRLLKTYGALAIWDYAGGGPYLPMEMQAGPGCEKDAIVFSPHKFPGGPGASGVMVIRDTIIDRDTPTWPGGGTVSFVSPWEHRYIERVEAREEGGTPNVVGDIRAALVMLVKQAVGTGFILQRDAKLRRLAVERWASNPRIRLLGGSKTAEALPIFSFQVLDENGELVHHQLITRMLSDRRGIQARGGCACAGPYAHRLLGLDETKSADLLKRLLQGEELEKPGWVRLNLSYLHSDEEIERILEGVDQTAEEASKLVERYAGDPQTARFIAREVVLADG